MTTAVPIEIDWAPSYGPLPPEFQLAAQHAAGVLAKRISLRSRYRQWPNRLDLIVHRDGSARRTIRRRTDGTIRVDPPPPERRWSDDYRGPEEIDFLGTTPLDDLEDELRGPAKRAIRRHIVQTFPGTRDEAHAFLKKSWPGGGGILVSHTVLRAICLALGEEPGGAGETIHRGREMERAARRLISHDLAEDVAFAVNTTCRPSPVCTIAQHNAAVRYGDVIMEAAAGRPILAMTWWNMIPESNGEPAMIRSIAQMEETVRRRLQLRPREWRTFVLVTEVDMEPGLDWEEREKRLEEHHLNGDEDITEFADAARALSRAMRPEDLEMECTEHLRGLASLPEHTKIQNLEGRNPEGRNQKAGAAWARILRLAIQAHEHESERGCSDFPGEDCREAARMAGEVGRDLMETLRNGQTWRNRSWKNHLGEVYPYVHQILDELNSVACPLTEEEIRRLERKHQMD